VPIEAQLISTARPSSTPIWPKKAPLSLLAAAATLILGFALVVTRELLGSARHQQVPVRADARVRDDADEPRLATPEAVSIIAAGQTAFATRRSSIQATERGHRSSATPGTAIALTPAAAAAAMSLSAPVSPPPIDRVARRLLGNAASQGGYRTILVGNKPGIDVREEAADLAGALSAAGVHVVLVDWNFDGMGMSSALGVTPSPGLMDLLTGRATFEQVIQRLPDGDAHIVPCGAAIPSDHMDADRINLTLDSLDEAYDHIIVAGRYAPIHDLFLTIQGRFDAAIEVREEAQAPVDESESDGGTLSTFLDFEVSEIDIIHFDRPPSRRRSREHRARQVSVARIEA
jgi:hypothetical protein